MRLQVLGCSHHETSIALREQIAFSSDQACSALGQLQREFPHLEAVLLSTCNRVELYTAIPTGNMPSARQLAGFVAKFHGLNPGEIVEQLYEREGPEAIKHLFLVASSLDSMVVGEPQIVAQVKAAYRLATEQKATGPLTHSAFQAAFRTSRRVASETGIHRHRVSIPSVAVADFAKRIFERFDDKKILLIGAGEMAEETLEYLRAEGACRVTVVNRGPQRALVLARRWNGTVQLWEKLLDAVAEADLIVSTTSAKQAIVTLEDFLALEKARGQRPLLIVDLAVPRDFDPAIGDRPAVYLYSIDDLRSACEANRRRRKRELPRALEIIEDEAAQFMTALNHRAVGPVVQRLRQKWQETMELELQRLSHKLPELDDKAHHEIHRAFDRLLNKLLHPPLESLHQGARHGTPEILLDAVSRLFRLKD